VIPRALGHLWMLPNTLASAVYLGIFMIFGWVRYSGTTPYAVVLSVRPGNMIYDYMHGKWAGWASGAFIIIREDCLHSLRTIAHEQAHVMQQMIFGIFHPLLYLLFMLFIAIFLRSKSPYYDNPFETDARSYGEQFAPDSLVQRDLGFRGR